MLTKLTKQQLSNLKQAYKNAQANDFNDPTQNDYESLLCDYLGYTPSNEELDLIEEQLNN